MVKINTAAVAVEAHDRIGRDGAKSSRQMAPFHADAPWHTVCSPKPLGKQRLAKKANFDSFTDEAELSEIEVSSLRLAKNRSLSWNSLKSVYLYPQREKVWRFPAYDGEIIFVNEEELEMYDDVSSISTPLAEEPTYPRTIYSPIMKDLKYCMDTDNVLGVASGVSNVPWKNNQDRCVMDAPAGVFGIFSDTKNTNSQVASIPAFDEQFKAVINKLETHGSSIGTSSCRSQTSKYFDKVAAESMNATCISITNMDTHTSIDDTYISKDTQQLMNICSNAWTSDKCVVCRGGSAYEVNLKPLTTEVIHQEDEFLILGTCDFWENMHSDQYAVNIVRKELLKHSDPRTAAGVLTSKKHAGTRFRSKDCTVVIVVLNIRQ